MFDSKLLEELPKLEKFSKMDREKLNPYIIELIDNLENRTYESVFLSFDEKDINSIIIFGGKPVYDPLYTSIYVKERNYRNLTNFDHCLKFCFDESLQAETENFSCFNIKKLKIFGIKGKLLKKLKIDPINFEEIKRTHPKKKMSGSRFKNSDFITQEIVNDMLEYLENERKKPLIYTGLTSRNHYDSTFSSYESLNDLQNCLTDTEKVFWKLTNMRVFDNNNSLNFLDVNVLKKYKSFDKTSIGDNLKELEYFSSSFLFEKIPKDFKISFKQFFDIKYVQNIVLAGGAVFGTLFNREFIDHDIFFHSCTPEIAKYIIDTFIIRAANHVESVTTNENVVTVILRKEDVINSYPFTDTTIVQFILRIYNSPSEIIHGFDTDFSCCLYDFYTNSVYVTERFMYAISNGFNTVNLEKLSPSYEYRLIKGFKRGMKIKVPMFKHMLKHLDIGNLQKERGLATILKYLINFQFSKERIFIVKNHDNYSDYSFGYFKTYTQNTELTFNITDPTSQAIGTFNRIIFEDYRNWFIFPKLTLREREDAGSLVTMIKPKEKCLQLSKFCQNLYNSMSRGTTIIGCSARNILYDNNFKDVIYILPEEEFKSDAEIGTYACNFLTKFIINCLSEDFECLAKNGIKLAKKRFELIHNLNDENYDYRLEFTILKQKIGDKEINLINNLKSLKRKLENFIELNKTNKISNTKKEILEIETDLKKLDITEEEVERFLFLKNELERHHEINDDDRNFLIVNDDQNIENVSFIIEDVSMGRTVGSEIYYQKFFRSLTDEQLEFLKTMKDLNRSFSRFLWFRIPKIVVINSYKYKYDSLDDLFKKLNLLDCNRICVKKEENEDLIFTYYDFDAENIDDKIHNSSKVKKSISSLYCNELLDNQEAITNLLI